MGHCYTVDHLRHLRTCRRWSCRRFEIRSALNHEWNRDCKCLFLKCILTKNSAEKPDFFFCLWVHWAFLHSSAWLWEVQWNQSKGQSLTRRVLSWPGSWSPAGCQATKHSQGIPWTVAALSRHKGTPAEQSCSTEREFCNSSIKTFHDVLTDSSHIKSKDLHFVSTTSFIAFSTGLCCLKSQLKNEPAAGINVLHLFMGKKTEQNNWVDGCDSTALTDNTGDYIGH